MINNEIREQEMSKVNVIYEDNHLIAVNKRAGDLTQKDKTGDLSLIEYVKSYIKKKYNKPGDVFLGSIHRLDRPTTGIVIFAKTSKALTRMNALFKNKKVQKTYLALVDRRPSEPKGKLENFLLKNPTKNKSFVTNSSKAKAKLAILEYELIKEVNGKFLLKVSLETGRHHQIRVQLANIGCRIIGDLKYGHKLANQDKSICLHCSELSFVHPVKKEPLRLIASLPQAEEWR